MSATPEQKQAAYDQFVASAYYPTFFGKLANAGYTPSTEAEAQQLVAIGGELFARYQAKEAAIAEKRGSFLDFAIAELGGDTRSNEGNFKEAANYAISDPAALAAGAILVEML